jgi:hypothetical protein
MPWFQDCHGYGWRKVAGGALRATDNGWPQVAGGPLRGTELGWSTVLSKPQAAVQQPYPGLRTSQDASTWPRKPSVGHSGAGNLPAVRPAL